MKTTPVPDCPCGTKQAFARCCEPYIKGTARAQTAEALMRSRYTAYTLRNETYLLTSWHSSTRPVQLDLHTDPIQWTGLKIVNTQAGQASDETGLVEFIARYKLNGKAHRLHELSQFIKQGGTWFYVDGKEPVPLA